VDPLGGLNQFCQDAAGRARVEEGDAAVADAAPRLLIDQLQPVRTAPLELLGDIRAPIGRVVETGATLGEKAPDGRFVTERSQQLYVRVADAEEHRLDALLGNRLAVLERHAEPLGVELDRSVEILDCDADVVDCLEHGEPV
jgi:hypothetical protein